MTCDRFLLYDNLSQIIMYKISKIYAIPRSSASSSIRMRAAASASEALSSSSTAESHSAALILADIAQNQRKTPKYDNKSQAGEPKSLIEKEADLYAHTWQNTTQKVSTEHTQKCAHNHTHNTAIHTHTVTRLRIGTHHSWHINDDDRWQILVKKKSVTGHHLKLWITTCDRFYGLRNLSQVITPLISKSKMMTCDRFA